MLTQLVLEDIREKARFAKYDPEQLVRQIIRLKDKEAKSRLSSCEQELKTYTARLSELERLIQNLYEDKCAGTIPQTVFQTLMHKYEAERAEKSEAIPELERKVKSYLENRMDVNRWLTMIRRYTEITELDESILFELLDRIEVGETQKSTDSGFVTSAFTTAMSEMWTRRWCRKKGGNHLKKQYKVGIYCRLSVDDASNSAKAKTISPVMNPPA